MTSRRVVATAVGALLLLSACTTVPASSPAQIVQSIPVGQEGDNDNYSPPRGLSARDVVESFIRESGSANDPNHTNARTLLTAEERTKWLDNKTTTVVDDAVIGNLGDGKITVSGSEVGTIDGATGGYSPSPRGNGTGIGGRQVSLTYGLTHEHGQWRIDSLAPGLVINENDFETNYQQRPLYFFDGAQEHLVPDPRYTSLTATQDITAWLIAGLAQGPRGAGLQTALPNQTDPKRIQVQFPTKSGAIRIEVPRATQLGIDDRDRLAAQIASTLAGVDENSELEITDGGKPVRIPGVGGTTFTHADLNTQYVVPSPGSTLYYISGHAVYTRGHPIDGKVGQGAYDLDSVAVTPSTTSDDLDIAGVGGAPGQQYLDVGTQDQLYRTRVHGDLSRPAWAPGADEVWIGVGADLYVVSLGGTARQVQVEAPQGKASGRIVAVRLSPEGSRVALVLQNSDGTSQIYLGAVVRNGSSVQVANLTPISPQGVMVKDIAWNDQLKLFVIGTDSTTNQWGLYEVQCDGSAWTLRSFSGLPQAPDSLTVTSGAVAVVAAGPTLWQQFGGLWRGLLRASTPGTNPVYVE